MDYFDAYFSAAQDRNQGGGYAPYRQCIKCGGFALLGSLSAHLKWCERQQALRG